MCTLLADERALLPLVQSGAANARPVNAWSVAAAQERSENFATLVPRACSASRLRERARRMLMPAERSSC